MPDRFESQSDAGVLRLLADGELGDAETLRAQALLVRAGVEGETARQQVADERRLRQSVARVMSGSTAPIALRLQIQDALSDVAIGESAVAGRIERGGVATVERRRSPLWRLFASPQHANFAAVAAVLALILGAVLFGIYGRTIDDVPPPHTVDVVGNVAQFVDDEHSQCTMSLEHIQKEATWHTPADAEVGMTEALGAPVHAFDLSSLGYDFVGAGRCDVPLEQQPSGHLMYRKTVNGQPGPMVSVFMAPLRGCCKGICAGLRPGEWQAAKGPAKRRVLYSTDGRLVYFLVCCDDRDMNPVGQAITLAQASGSR